jgi:MFS family permease
MKSRFYPLSRPLSMITLLRQPKLCRFFLAHGQSQLGTSASYVALVLIAYQRLHSSWAVALVLLADFLPGILLSPYFGVLADRHSRRKLAITAELLRAAAFAALSLSGSIGATVGLALLAGIGTALFNPAISAALPTLVAPEQRSRATALYGALHNIGFTIGPALCGLVLLIGPPTWVLLANAATFVASAALLADVPLGGGSGAAENGDCSAWEDAKQGARYAAREPGVGALLLIGAMSVLCSAVINVAEPILATGPLHAGSSGFSILMTLYGVGLVAGAAYTARLGSRVSTLRAHFLAGVGLTGVAMLACATAGSLVSALAPFAVAGFANALCINPEVRLLQELVAEKLRGRVFGLRDGTESACFALAFIAAGGLLSVIGPRSIYVLSGVLLLGTAILGLLVFKLPRQARRPSERLAGDARPAARLA